MAHYAIVVDLDRCIGCHGCEIACKNENEVELGSFWNKVVQVGPFGDYPHLHQYFLPVMCQQCDDSPCTHVCPTGASYRDENNVVLVDKEKCIGCKYCMMACPYGVRSWSPSEHVVEKCTLCEQKIAQGELPQCVAQCGSRARFFGDLEQGVDGFEAPAPPQALSCDYAEMQQTRVTLKEYVEPYTEDEIHRLPDVGNGPELMYLLRSDRKWRG